MGQGKGNMRSSVHNGNDYANINIGGLSVMKVQSMQKLQYHLAVPLRLKGGLQYQSVGNKVSHVKAPKTGDDFLLYDLFNIFK